MVTQRWALNQPRPLKDDSEERKYAAEAPREGGEVAKERIQPEAKPRLARAKALATKAAADKDAELYDERTLDMLVARAEHRAAPVVAAPSGLAPVVPRLS
ncbi:hypothetical protein DFH09DRAFT_1327426 [Mycena vulgaris]|nr:hypothetical protein DFH09DRAFT_1327426 [Mycena vulgaris]